MHRAARRSQSWRSSNRLQPRDQRKQAKLTVKNGEDTGKQTRTKTNAEKANCLTVGQTLDEVPSTPPTDSLRESVTCSSTCMLLSDSVSASALVSSTSCKAWDHDYTLCSAFDCNLSLYSTLKKMILDTVAKKLEENSQSKENEINKASPRPVWSKLADISQQD